MNQLTTFEHPIFGSLPVLVIEGIEWFGATEAAIALSFGNPYKAVDNHVEREDCTVHTVLTNGGNQQKKFINESGLYSLIFGAAKQGNNPEIKEKARKFKRWVTSEVLPQIRKTGSYTGFTDEKKIAFETHLIGVEYASKILNVDNTSKIKMLEEAHKHHGVPTNHLPQYVDEEVTMSLTALLKKYGVKMGAAKFNTKLIELGILEIKERPSSKGGVKEFKSITEKGLYYGKNLINPKSPKETQPHYYESKFSELLRIVFGEAA